MATLTKTAITSILLGDSVEPSIANTPHDDLETNIDNLIAYLKSSTVGSFEYDSVASSGLTFEFDSGTFNNKNASTLISAGNRSLGATTTNYVEINTSTSLVTHNTSAFTTANIPLWEVTTDVSSITGVTDRRTSFGIYNTLGIVDTATGSVLSLTNALSTFSNAVTLGSTSTISGIMTHNARPAFNGGGASSPFTVNSSVVVTNLNADLLDNQHGSYYATAAHIHTTYDRASSVLSGASVFSNIVVTDGITTAISTRALTIANLGITATTTEVNYTTDVTSNIQAQLNLKAAIASPIFTGNPRAPTPITTDNDTSIATTAFVKTGLNSLTGTNVQDVVAGATKITYNAKTYTGSQSYSNTLQFSYLAPTDGEYRFEFGQKWDFASGGGEQMIVYIYRNGVNVASVTKTAATSSLTIQTLNVSGWTASDEIQIRVSSSGGSGNTWNLSDFYIRVNNPFLFPAMTYNRL